VTLVGVEYNEEASGCINIDKK